MDQLYVQLDLLAFHNRGTRTLVNVWPEHRGALVEFQGYMIFIAEKCTRIALKKSHMVNEKTCSSFQVTKCFIL